MLTTMQEDVMMDERRRAEDERKPAIDNTYHHTKLVSPELKPSRQSSEFIVRWDAMKPVANNEMRSKLSAHIPMPSKRRENSCRSRDADVAVAVDGHDHAERWPTYLLPALHCAS